MKPDESRFNFVKVTTNYLMELKFFCFRKIRRDLQSLMANEELASVSVDPDEGNGELIISIPDSLKDQIKSNYLYT